MKTVGLITEYNPFHLGHEHHIQMAKERSGADFAVAVMSGDFVQRGAPALLSKEVRTRMALLGGADLVLELPVSFATASAEKFAWGSVWILNQLGIIDTLCFGCECGSEKPLMEAAQILAQEPAWYRQSLQENLKSGLSFPAARAAALPEYADLLESPNNILGIEYGKSLIRQNASIRPLGIRREGSNYHEATLPERFASASALRKRLLSGRTDSNREDVLMSIQSYFSAPVFEILRDSVSKNSLLCEDDFSGILVYRLMTAESPDDFCPYADISEELAARIFKNRYRFRSFSQFADLLKTREITRTRINRALLHLILNTKKDSDTEPFARLLGFRKRALPLLGEMKKNSCIPLLTRTAAYSKVLPTKQQACMREDMNASMIYDSILSLRCDRSIRCEQEKQIQILP